MPAERAHKSSSPLSLLPRSMSNHKSPKDQYLNSLSARDEPVIAVTTARPPPISLSAMLDLSADGVEPPRSPSPTVSSIASSPIVSGFSSEDEDWAEMLVEDNGGMGVAPASPTSDPVDISLTDKLNPALCQQVAESHLPHNAVIPPAQLSNQLSGIQAHLLDITQLLHQELPKSADRQSLSSALAKVDHLERSLASMRHENNDYKQKTKQLQTIIDAHEKRRELLEAHIDRLQASSFEKSLEEVSRASIGIDPGKVYDLAVDLSIGARTKNGVADALFDLADKAKPYPSDPDELKREKLAPRERLRNVEGVVDVTLGRIEEIEKKLVGVCQPGLENKVEKEAFNFADSDFEIFGNQNAGQVRLGQGSRNPPGLQVSQSI